MVGRFRWIEESADAVTAEEGIEQNGEAFGIKNGDDFGVGRDERSRRHVGAEDGGFVFRDSGSEEVVLTLVVKSCKPAKLDKYALFSGYQKSLYHIFKGFC
ncbi:hypothetical protein LXL04_038332 [Taraxacum kok-saghyz]